MPDQSSAATEHAILQEITAPLATLPDDPVAVVVNADFPIAMRGYDRLAVDAYVQETSRLVAELHATRSPEAAVRRALERLGEQISGVLQRAHETGEQITAQSRSEAEDRLVQARIEAAEITAAAQTRVTDLDVDTDRIWSERRRIVDDARELAQQLLALAETAAERFPAAEPTPYDADSTTTTRAPIVVDDVAPSRPPAADDVEEPEVGYAADPESGYDDEPEYDDEPVSEGAPAFDEVDEPEPSAEDPSGRRAAGDDIEATVAFSPIDPDTLEQRGEDPASEASAPRGEDPLPEASPPPSPNAAPRRPSSSVIPPASQAANRRSSR